MSSDIQCDGGGGVGSDRLVHTPLVLGMFVEIFR